MKAEENQKWFVWKDQINDAYLNAFIFSERKYLLRCAATHAPI